MRTRAATRACDNHPYRNEDTYFATDSGGLGVFDGLGGHVGSEQAAAIASRVVESALNSIERFLHPLEAEGRLRESLYLAHRAIVAEQLESHNNIATTAVIAQLFESTLSDMMYLGIAHAGDSRAYILRDGRFVYTTLDHSLTTAQESEREQRRVQSMISSAHYLDEIDPYDWRHVSQRNYIDSCLGGRGHVKIAATHLPVLSGDAVLLTSDGIHDNLTDLEIRNTLSRYALVAPDELVNRAYERSREPREVRVAIGGEQFNRTAFRPKPDDMTAVVRLIE